MFADADSIALTAVISLTGLTGSIGAFVWLGLKLRGTRRMLREVTMERDAAIAMLADRSLRRPTQH